MITGAFTILDKKEDIHTDNWGKFIALRLDNFYEKEQPLIILFSREAENELIDDILKLRGNGTKSK